ncbi:PqiC family protein [Burkholderia vietnamiensis]|uniref:PqiC family protein n=1 Tax=Burkholderia vietnamiensis TaxID=60552 RepID=UPI003855F300
MIRRSKRRAGDAAAPAPMKWAVVALAAVLAAVLAGCGHSPPTRYVALSATPATSARADGPIEPVQLTAVHVPAELDRPEVVVQRSANRVWIDEGARWAGPLDRMMRRTLAQDLLTRLPMGAVVLPDAPRPPDTRTLVVTVLDVHADDGGTLTLEAAWTVLAGRPERVSASRETTLTASLTQHGAAAQAAALSAILGRLADQIAAGLPPR